MKKNLPLILFTIGLSTIVCLTMMIVDSMLLGVIYLFFSFIMWITGFIAIYEDINNIKEIDIYDVSDMD
jgi:hypothetical protein